MHSAYIINMVKYWCQGLIACMNMHISFTYKDAAVNDLSSCYTIHAYTVKIYYLFHTTLLSILYMTQVQVSTPVSATVLTQAIVLEATIEW